jgi:hypothetical protein
MGSKCFRVTVVPYWRRKPTGVFGLPALRIRFPSWPRLPDTLPSKNASAESNVVDLFPIPEGLNFRREAWAATPAVLRDEIIRMAKEFKAGFEKYRPAAERDASMQEFHDMAAAGGTTLKAALEKYVAVEQRLREDPRAEICRIIARVGIDDPVEFFRNYLDDHGRT